ncbi:MAG: cytochrome c biogenesis CcdA family protein [Christensenellales bacterium]|jgi:cytochrome c-type biogenesis protein
MQAVGIGSVFLAGIISFFSPCVLPVLPVFISTLLGSVDGSVQLIKTRRLNISLKPIIRVMLFVFGLSTSFVIMGLAFGTLGRLINSGIFTVICGITVIILGIYQTGLVKVSFLMREKKLESRREKKDLLSAFLLGFTFSFGWTPCIGPVLAAVLALTASYGGTFTGMFYMIIYSLGLLVPFLIFTAFSDMLMGKIRAINRSLKIIKIIGGVIIIIMGIFLLTDSLYLFTLITA